MLPSELNTIITIITTIIIITIPTITTTTPIPIITNIFLISFLAPTEYKTCPFPSTTYRMVYRKDAQAVDTCDGDVDSVGEVDDDTITLTSCDSDFTYGKQKISNCNKYIDRLKRIIKQ